MAKAAEERRRNAMTRATPVEVLVPEPSADREERPIQQDVSLVDLSRQVEAILMTSDRAISALRIAQALSITIFTPEEPQNLQPDCNEPAPESSAAPTGPAAPDSCSHVRIEEAIIVLNEVYDSTGRSFRIEKVAGGYRVMTRAEFGPTLAAMSRTRRSGRLTQPALETLAIVAYRQPITRSDVESIRGVACGEVLRTLLEIRLVKIVGRAEEIGRPMLYGTTREFLESFGLSSLKDLPDAKELKAP